MRLAFTLAIAVLLVDGPGGQSSSTETSVRYEVASVRPVDSTTRFAIGPPVGGTVRAPAIEVRRLIQYAYGLDPVYALVIARTDGALGPALRPSKVDCRAYRRRFRLGAIASRSSRCPGNRRHADLLCIAGAAWTQAGKPSRAARSGGDRFSGETDSQLSPSPWLELRRASQPRLQTPIAGSPGSRATRRLLCMAAHRAHA